jgi:tRNA threonylcarbamoyladenosine biosynthesis protein TsaE
MKQKTYRIKNEAEMLDLGGKLAQNLQNYAIIYLCGELGAGKTTLVRGVLHSLGHSGKVKSPTYTLVESYYLAGKRINHFDLYRLQNSEELEQIGFRDYLKDAICLIEWPERGQNILPKADIVVAIKIEGNARTVTFCYKN